MAQIDQEHMVCVGQDSTHVLQGEAHSDRVDKCSQNINVKVKPVVTKTRTMALICLGRIGMGQSEQIREIKM